MIDTYMSAIGFTKENDEGRYSNGTYLVWDVVPRNVLVDADGDMYVVDAEIKRRGCTRGQEPCAYKTSHAPNSLCLCGIQSI